jgi:hypothetical protein
VVPKLNILMLAICGKVLVMVTIGISGKGETDTLSPNVYVFSYTLERFYENGKNGKIEVNA